MIVFTFWAAIATILYTFLGFPVLIGLFAKWFARPVRQQAITPTVTLLIPAYNEAAVIAEKLENSLALDYPSTQLDIVIVTDGSNDETMAIVEQYANRGVRLFHQPERRGKIAAVNRVMPLMTSEIIVFSDANGMLDKGTIKALTRNFADPDVGAVAGEKQVSAGGEGLYWRYESFLKTCDSAISSVMGAAGELFAVRRELFAPPEPDSIIEDFVMSMRLVGDGWRVVYEPTAVSREEATSSLAADWQRRTRIAAGGFQSIARLGHLLDLRRGRISWQYISHRVLRWAVTPFLLPLVFVLNWVLWKRPLQPRSVQAFYRLLALGQTAFYGAGLVGYWQAKRGKQGGLLYTIFFFCFTNLAAIVGFGRRLTNRQPVTWEKAR